MTTQEIADQLVWLCRNGKVEEAKEQLFVGDVISIEPVEGLLPRVTKGMEGIRNKANLFISFVDEFYGDSISDPIVAGDYFAITWTSDLKMKGEERKINTELCVYQTKDSKIVSEQFYY